MIPFILKNPLTIVFKEIDEPHKLMAYPKLNSQNVNYVLHQ